MIQFKHKNEIKEWIHNIKKYINKNINPNLSKSQYIFIISKVVSTTHNLSFDFDIYIKSKRLNSIIKNFYFNFDNHTSIINIILNDNRISIDYDDFLKWLDENLIKLYSIRILKFYEYSINYDITIDIDIWIEKNISHEYIANIIKILPDEYQDRYDYLINAKKFDLI